MKKAIVCLTLALFAVASSAQAGENCQAGKTACADKAKTAATKQVSASSCAAKEQVAAASCSSKVATANKSACCAAKALAKRNALEKGATRLARL